MILNRDTGNNKHNIFLQHQLNTNHKDFAYLQSSPVPFGWIPQNLKECFKNFMVWTDILIRIHKYLKFYFKVLLLSNQLGVTESLLTFLNCKSRKICFIKWKNTKPSLSLTLGCLDTSSLIELGLTVPFLWITLKLPCARKMFFILYT